MLLIYWPQKIGVDPKIYVGVISTKKMTNTDKKILIKDQVIGEDQVK